MARCSLLTLRKYFSACLSSGNEFNQDCFQRWALFFQRTLLVLKYKSDQLFYRRRYRRRFNSNCTSKQLHWLSMLQKEPRERCGTYKCVSIFVVNTLCFSLVISCILITSTELSHCSYLHKSPQIMLHTI